ncbi:MAG: translation initiation factor IF-2 [Sulfolobales archaeon]|nr:translation initiation factor IF-2 [Sulfolobales archaeon]MDW8083286.1 translation initiation factor IF-2 [Sulfolobales archaeon]
MTEKTRVRSPIVTVLGHVDHGKTTLLDKIRGTAIIKKEPGEMTQHVGASFVPLSVIEDIVKPLRKVFPIKLTIPGLLFIDTPGHEIFANLRKRGGAVADFAIVVVDVVEGVMPQTVESIEILMNRKVPFLIAANKIDRISGWRSYDTMSFLESARNQSSKTVEELDRLIYRLIGQLLTLNIPSERFDRIKDFTKSIAVVPISAKTGEGIAELLAVLAGLVQRYLVRKIMFAEGPARGVVLEVKEVSGVGTCADVIVYDGVLSKGDIIVVGGIVDPIITHVRVILVPKPLEEIRVTGAELVAVDEVAAAAGVRIAAPNLENAIAGAPVYAAKSEEDVEQLVMKVREEVATVRFSRNINGVIVKADTLGTLEALTSALERRGIPIRLADIGPLTKREVLEAALVSKENRYLGVAILFNVGVLADAEEVAREKDVKIFMDKIMYKLIEAYEDWVREEKTRELEREFSKLATPAKVRVLPGYVFRRSDPAIVGIEVISGLLRPGSRLMRKDGRVVGEVMQIQSMGKPVREARRGDRVAISIRGNIIVGRHFDEGDILYTEPSESELLMLIEKFPGELSEDLVEATREVAEVLLKKGKLSVHKVLNYLRGVSK